MNKKPKYINNDLTVEEFAKKYKIDLDPERTYVVIGHDINNNLAIVQDDLGVYEMVITDEVRNKRLQKLME